MLIVSPKDEGVWREYAPGVRANIRPMSRSRYRELVKQNTRDIEEFRDGRRVRRREVDQDALDRALYRELVEDWEGVVDEGLEPLPPTDENVDLVCDRVPDFANWLVAESNSLEAELTEGKAAELKNFEASHDGMFLGQE
jgi:hypothetical protein